MFDLAIRAFNLSEKYRIPVIVLSDEMIGHMYEKVVIPERRAVPRISRKKPRTAADEFYPFQGEKDLIPPMACAGDGYRIHVTGLTHDEQGYPVISADAQERLVRRLCDKIRLHAGEIIDFRETATKDADVIVVAYGCSARSAEEAVGLSRREGIRVGLLRLVTVWPFPEERVRQLAERVKGFVVPEVNYGQIAYEVERCAGGKETLMMGLMGGAVHNPEMIMNAIKEMAESGKAAGGERGVKRS
jgi:2-oxoglutarate ferredoxin oxidoreductase subunit alpha